VSPGDTGAGLKPTSAGNSQNDGSSEQAGSGSEAVALPAARHKNTLTIRLAAAVVFVAILVYWFRPSLPAPRVSGFVRLTHDAVLKHMVGTDGARIYLWEILPGSFAQLAQVSAAGGDVVSVQTPSTDFIPITVSPDGSKVLAKEKPGSVRDVPLWALPTLGGTPRRLAGAVGHSGAWSPDGQKLVYGNGNNLFLANADGTAHHKLAGLMGEAYDLAWSPDGRKIRFSLATSGIRPVAIWQVSADGTKLHQLLPGWNPTAAKCCGRWTPDGNYFLFESNGQIWARREVGSILHKVSHAPVQLTNGPLAYLGVRPSRDGKKLFAIVGVPRGELNRYDRKARAFEPYLGGISAQDVAFSRDAKWVAYVSFPEGTLWRARADGSEKIQLTFPPIYAVMPRWSPDGKEIVFSDLGGTRPTVANQYKPFRICLVAADGGKVRELAPNNSHSQIDGTWSPDGRSVAFSLDVGTPDAEIRIFDVKTHQVSAPPESQGFFSPRWSPAGRYIAAMKGDAESLWLYGFKTRKWSLLAKVSAAYPCWSRNGSYVYFIHWTKDPSIMRVAIGDRKVERVVRMNDFKTTGYWGIWLGLAPDDSPLVLKDTGTEEVVSMDFIAP
jgi:Tol biopolymer transport system component